MKLGRFIPSSLIDLIPLIFSITILGCSARYLSALEEQQITPGTHNRLETLHTILSTGSPLHSRIFDYVYKDIKTDVLLGSITGGTDIM